MRVSVISAKAGARAEDLAAWVQRSTTLLESKSMGPEATTCLGKVSRREPRYVLAFS